MSNITKGSFCLPDADFFWIIPCMPKEWKESIGFPDAELCAELLEKIIKIKYSRSSLNLENSPSGHQQRYDFFSVFADFRTLADNSGKPKSIDLKQKN